WDARHLQSVPEALDSMAGALRMIPLTQAAGLVLRCEQYVRAELMAGHVPAWAELDHLADALSGIDYYLERLASGHAGGADDVLDLVQRSLDGLGAAAPEAGAAPDPEPVADASQPEPAQQAEAADSGLELVEGLSLAGSAQDPGLDQIGTAADQFDVVVPEPEAEADAEVEPEPAAEPEPEAEAELEPVTPADAEAQPLFGQAEEVDVSAVGEGDEGDEPELALETEDDFDLSSGLFDSIAGQVGVEAAEDTTPTEPVREPDEEPVVEPVEASAEAPAFATPTVAPTASPAALGLAATLADTFDADADIVEIFGEEVDEVLAAVDAQLAAWQADPADEARLTDIRRAFHTLKGSGRMVGANVLGEMAWSVENMLNRLLDGTVPASAEFAMVVAEARNLAPMLKAAFESRTPPPMDGVARVMEQADVLASGGALADAEEAAAAGHDEAQHATPAADEHRALFLEEAASLHADLEAACAGAGFRLDDAALRALHTLSGSASMAGMPAVGELVAPAYELAQAVRRPDGEAALGGELGEFVRQVTAAIGDMLTAVSEGREPEDAFQLVAEADRLLLESEGTAANADARLLALPALGTLLKAPEFLEAWHSGAMDMAFAESLERALGEVADVAAEDGHAALSALARALAAAYQRFEFESLDERAWRVLADAQEQVLAQVDAIAAQQQPQPVGQTIALLEVLMPEAAVDPELEQTFDDDFEPEAEPETFELEELELTPPALGSDEPADTEPADTEPAETEPADLPTVASAQDADAVVLPEEIDADIIGVFFEEADELLEAMDQSINDWSGEPANRLHLENLLRALHTLKGGARLSGLSDLGDRVHQFESFLIEVQEGTRSVNAALFDALHERFDGLNHLLTRIRQAVADAGVAAPAESEAPAVPKPAAEAAPAPAAAKPEAPATGNVQPLRPAAAAPQTAKPAAAAARRAADSAARESAAQEMVRVGAGLLEALVNLAGESSIIRARVEQGMSDFTSALDEMETTIERLREQLRRLEIETETQVLFRQERLDAPSYDEFDPLEMDRYSQLQQLSRSLSESASDMLDLKDTLLFKAREAETLLLQQARVNTELQEGLMRSRMVPFSRLLPRLRRTVRQVAKELDKSVELHAFNIEGELDRSLLERMVPPLEHMLRNAVDHGIEPAAERRAHGKAEAGRIDLRLSREGGDVVIEISDDGAGIDVTRVRAKAVERGLMAADAHLRDDEISQFVLAPGFSTARSVTQISGRGVGMDVVHSEVKQLGGSISINSEPGRGTRFVVRVPFTVSVNRALMVSVGDDLYAIPLNTIEGIVLLGRDELDGLYAPDGNTFEYAGVPYRVQYLGSFLGREYRPTPLQGSVPVVLVRSGEHAVAVHVDGVQGSREIVVKSLGPQFAGVGGISGATILGDGSVVVILDLLALIRAQAGSGGAAGKRALSGAPRTRCVMVVDDSVTVRKVTSRLLERQGMDVMVAKDGVEAVSMLQERRPDVMLLDIEMPRMDGFEVLRQVRHDARLRDLPVVMISSRTGAKHQDRAAELGVDRFLGKPFQESELLGTIDELVGRS
ncbi:MAG: Hpt domain-containing protein, partial [Pseudomonadales bacterium]